MAKNNKKMTLEQRLERIENGLPASPNFAFQVMKQASGTKLLRIIELVGFSSERFCIISAIRSNFPGVSPKDVTIGQISEFVFDNWDNPPEGMAESEMTKLAGCLYCAVDLYMRYVQKCSVGGAIPPKDSGSFSIPEAYPVAQLLNVNLRSYINVTTQAMSNTSRLNRFAKAASQYCFSDQISLNQAMLIIADHKDISSRDYEYMGKAELDWFVGLFLLPMAQMHERTKSSMEKNPGLQSGNNIKSTKQRKEIA